MSAAVSRVVLNSLYPRKSLNGIVSPPALDPARLALAKYSFTTRNVNRLELVTLLTERVKPHAGDLVLARVKKIAQHTRLQLPGGRRASLFPGDEIVVSYGNRYAPDQFEAVVPEDLSSCHLVAAGGIAAQALSWHSRLKSPTTLEPIGLLGDAEGVPANLRNFRSVPHAPQTQGKTDGLPRTEFDIPALCVLGTAMNAGKTTTAAYLIKGLRRAGMRVAAIKVTGTGAGNDLWLMKDAGADPVVDFTDAGYVSTYKTPTPEIEQILQDLLAYARGSGVDCVVVEVADGLYHKETADLVRTATFQHNIAGVLFCGGDAMGAAAGVDWLEQNSIPVLAVSGALTASKLARQEAARVIGLPVLAKEQLADARVREIVTPSFKKSRAQSLS